MRLCHGFGGLPLFWAHCSLAVPPTLYSQPGYESPVRGDPGDLLLLPGYGFAASDTVVYQAIADTTQLLDAPHRQLEPLDNIKGLLVGVHPRSVEIKMGERCE